MLNLKEIERYVSNGFVLDWDGNWCPVNEVVDEESDYLHHLEDGEIIKDGRWVKIDEVLKVGLQEENIKHKNAENDIPPDDIDTKVLYRKEDKVQDEESKDNRDLDTKSLKVAEVEKANSKKSKPPDKKKGDTSEVQSDWDKARTIKSKLIILPIVGVIVIVVVIILIFL